MYEICLSYIYGCASHLVDSGMTHMWRKFVPSRMARVCFAAGRALELGAADENAVLNYEEGQDEEDC